MKRDRSLEGRPWCARCHATGVALDLHHKVMKAYDIRAALTADDGEMLCRPCHREETRRQAGELAKTNRLAAKPMTKTAPGAPEIMRRFKQ